MSGMLDCTTGVSKEDTIANPTMITVIKISIQQFRETGEAVFPGVGGIAVPHNQVIIRFLLLLRSAIIPAIRDKKTGGR